MSLKHSLIAFCLLCQVTGVLAEDQADHVNLSWELGYARDYNSMPSKWIQATVPGAVQLDIARAEKYQTFYYAEHWKDYLWMEDMYYTYRTSFNRPDLPDDKRLVFVSLGIDYEFEIYLNGDKIFYQEGMFTPVRIDLTDKLKDKNSLLVKIFPVPKLHHFPCRQVTGSTCR